MRSHSAAASDVSRVATPPTNNRTFCVGVLQPPSICRDSAQVTA